MELYFIALWALGSAMAAYVISLEDEDYPLSVEALAAISWPFITLYAIVKALATKRDEDDEDDDDEIEPDDNDREPVKEGGE